MSDTAFSRLIEELADGDPDTRRHGLEQLGKLGDERAVQAIAVRRSDPETEVSIAAIKALEQIGGQAAIQALVEALVEEDRFFYDEYEPGIHSSDYAQHALRRIGKPAIPELIKALYNDDWIGSSVRCGRWRAAWTLGQLGDPDAVPGLTKALGEVGDDVRASVASALGRIGDAAAVPYLIERLRDDPMFKVRQWSLFALGRIADASAVPGLITSGLTDPDPRIRRGSIIALEEIGDETAVPAVVKMLEDENDQVRSRAVHALEGFGTEEALTALAARRDQ